MRKQLIEILRKPIFPHELVDPLEAVADYLLDNDVVPVVRCKDCKYRGVDGECPMYHEECIEWVDDEYAECEYVPQDNTHDDGFCDCGAKMDGDEDAG